MTNQIKHFNTAIGTDTQR